MLPLEDNYVDVMTKAQRGWKVTDAALAEECGIAPAALAAFKEGKFDAGIARRIVPMLKLGADALVELGTHAWQPEPHEVRGLAQFTTPFKDMTVNSFLAFDEISRKAVVFDTGMKADALLQFIAENKLKVDLILITHTHQDHIAELVRVKKETGAPAFVGELEKFKDAEAISPGATYRAGNLKIEARQTSGHARGGMTYVVTGLSRRVAIVGDAIFASSMGGGNISFEEALRTNRNEIFSLPDETVLCPGHGPLTTVGEQKKHNPFYPEFQH